MSDPVFSAVGKVNRIEVLRFREVQCQHALGSEPAGRFDHIVRVAHNQLTVCHKQIVTSRAQLRECAIERQAKLGGALPVSGTGGQQARIQRLWQRQPVGCVQGDGSLLAGEC